MTPYEKAFHETLSALGQEQLENLVVIGGWCPYLYAKYVWRQESPFPSTVDVDFVVKKMMPDRFSGPVYKREIKKLRKHESFQEFRGIIKELFLGRNGRGYQMLRPFFSQWGVPEERVQDQITKTFEPLMAAVNLDAKG